MSLFTCRKKDEDSIHQFSLHYLMLQISGIDKILPCMKIDDYLFEPCGYSMNGILRNESTDYGLGEYMTIHITPEPEYSYVSFESNIPLSSYLGVIQRVLETFMPGKFILTIFANRVSITQWRLRELIIEVSDQFQTSTAADSHQELRKCSRFGDWLRKDAQYSQFQNYELTYAHFVRFPSWGKSLPGSSPGRIREVQIPHFSSQIFSFYLSLLLISFITQNQVLKSIQNHLIKSLLTSKNPAKHYIQNRLLCSAQWRSKISWWYIQIQNVLAVFLEFIAFQYFELAWDNNTKFPVIAFSQNENSITDIKDDDAEDYTPIIPLICSIFWPMYPQKKNMCNKILFMEHDTITKRNSLLNQFREFYVLKIWSKNPSNECDIQLNGKEPQSIWRVGFWKLTKLVFLFEIAKKNRATFRIVDVMSSHLDVVQKTYVVLGF